MAKKSYIDFEEIAPKIRTKVWAVVSKSSGEDLGTISYYGPWRQYCFNPGAIMVFSKVCLEEITKFIEEHKNDRVGE